MLFVTSSMFTTAFLCSSEALTTSAMLVAWAGNARLSAVQGPGTVLRDLHALLDVRGRGPEGADDLRLRALDDRPDPFKTARP
jgi:hypothetical protein